MHQQDSISSPFLSWADMVKVVGKLKTGKSSNSFLKAEHILHGSPKLITHIHLLFNSLIQHGFVPTTFLSGTITPVVKNNDGDLNSPDNYWGITLCNTFSHLFENALRLKFGQYLASDELQFWFKPKHGTITQSTHLNLVLYKEGFRCLCCFLWFFKGFWHHLASWSLHTTHGS